MTRLTSGRRATKALRTMSETQFRQAAAAFEQFVADPRHPGPNFEKRRGREDFHSIRITQGDRATLRRTLDADGELFEVVLVGSHDVHKAASRV